MRHLKGAISDKNVSFLSCFSKISNFRFFILRSCFCSGVVSLFGSSELPLSPGQMTQAARPPVWLILSSTPSCMIDITQHALKGQKLCKLSGFLKLLPLQGVRFATHKNPGRCPGLRASALSGVLLIWASCLLGVLLILASCLQGVLLIWAFNYPVRLLILAKKQPKYLEVTKFQSIFAKE